MVGNTPGMHSIRLAMEITDLTEECDHLKAINNELLVALEFLIAAAETEPGMSIYKAHIAEAQIVVAKAKGVKS